MQSATRKAKRHRTLSVSSQEALPDRLEIRSPPNYAAKHGSVSRTGRSPSVSLSDAHLMQHEALVSDSTASSPSTSHHPHKLHHPLHAAHLIPPNSLFRSQPTDGIEPSAPNGTPEIQTELHHSHGTSESEIENKLHHSHGASDEATHKLHDSQGTSDEPNLKSSQAASSLPAMSSSSSPSNKKEAITDKPRGGQACLECRMAKVRCLASTDSDLCQRCHRFHFECVFIQHKRGRKPKSKLQGRHLTLLAEAATASTGLGHSNLSPLASSVVAANAKVGPPLPSNHLLDVDVGRMTRAMHQAMRSLDRIRSAPFTLVTNGEMANVENSQTLGDAATPTRLDTNAVNESLELIAKQPLTLRVMLKPFEVAQHPTSCLDFPRTVQHDRIPVGPQQQQQELHINDPITTGVLTEPAARALFELYMSDPNSWSQVFDPTLYTHDYVRKRSSFLYTALLYVASRFTPYPTAHHLVTRQQRGETVTKQEWDVIYRDPNSDSTPQAAQECACQVRKQLLLQAREHAARAFVNGDRTVSCCLAFFILATWKPLDDGLSVIQVGYAFRLAMDIQLHAEMPNCVKPNEAKLDLAGQQRYEAVQKRFRDRQRTFLMLFVQDKNQQISNKISTHSISADNVLIRKCQQWWKAPGSVPGDAFVCANVDLRRIQAKYTELLERIEAISTPTGDGPTVILPAFLNDLEEWTARWHDAMNLHQTLDEENQLENPTVFERRCRRLALQVWKDNLKAYLSSTTLKFSLKQAALSRHQQLLRSRHHRQSVTRETNDRDSRASTQTQPGPAVVNLMDMPAFGPCVEGARGVLEALTCLPPERLRVAPDATILHATHAAVLLCSLATVESQPPLGSGYLKTTIELIAQASLVFRRASLTNDDTTYHIAVYLESLLRPQNAAEPRTPKPTSASSSVAGSIGSNALISNSVAQFFSSGASLANSQARPATSESRNTNGAGSQTVSLAQNVNPTDSTFDPSKIGRHNDLDSSLFWNTTPSHLDGGLHVMATAASVAAAATASGGEGAVPCAPPYNDNDGAATGAPRSSSSPTVPSCTTQMDIGNLTWPHPHSSTPATVLSPPNPTNPNPAALFGDDNYIHPGWNVFGFNQDAFIQEQEPTDETLQMLLRFLDN